MPALPSILKSSFRLAATAVMLSGFARVQHLVIGDIIAGQYGGQSQYLTMQGYVTEVLHPLYRSEK